MSILAFIAITSLLIALFQILRVLLSRPAKEQSLMELECEMMRLDAECALAVRRARQQSRPLQPNQI